MQVIMKMLISAKDKGLFARKSVLAASWHSAGGSVEDSDKERLRTLPFALTSGTAGSTATCDSMEFSHRRACLSTGRTYHYIDQRTRQHQRSTLLCLHGFPDLWYGWRHQIGPWVAGGYRVVVPDMLGYGETDMPLEASAYSTKRLCDDLAALLDHLGVQKAVSICSLCPRRMS